jgi:hypothetical protein
VKLLLWRWYYKVIYDSIVLFILSHYGWQSVVSIWLHDETLTTRFSVARKRYDLLHLSFMQIFWLLYITKAVYLPLLHIEWISTTIPDVDVNACTATLAWSSILLSSQSFAVPCSRRSLSYIWRANNNWTPLSPRHCWAATSLQAQQHHWYCLAASVTAASHRAAAAAACTLTRPHGQHCGTYCRNISTSRSYLAKENGLICKLLRLKCVLMGINRNNGY